MAVCWKPALGAPAGADPRPTLLEEEPATEKPMSKSSTSPSPSSKQNAGADSDVIDLHLVLRKSDVLDAAVNYGLDVAFWTVLLVTGGWAL